MAPKQCELKPLTEVLLAPDRSLQASQLLHWLARRGSLAKQAVLLGVIQRLGESELDFYLPQLCHFAILRNQEPVREFLVMLASLSVHFMLKLCWLLHGTIEDAADRDLTRNARLLLAAVTNQSRTHHGFAIWRAQGHSQDDSWLSRSLRHKDRRSSSVPRDLRVPAGDARQGRSSFRPEPRPSIKRAAAPRRPVRCIPLNIDDHQIVFFETMGVYKVDASSLGMDGVCYRQSLNLHDRDPTGDGPKNGDIVRGTKAGEFVVVECGEESPEELEGCDLPCSRKELLERLEERCRASSMQPLPGTRLPRDLPRAHSELGSPVKSPSALDHCVTQQSFATFLEQLSANLATISDRDERQAQLARGLNCLNRWLFDRRAFMAASREGPLRLLGIHLPMLANCQNGHQVLRVHTRQCRVFSSATRAPFSLMYEVADLDCGTEGKLNNRLCAPAPATAELLALSVKGDLSSRGVDAGSEGPLPLALQQQLGRLTEEDWLEIDCSAPPMPPPAQHPPAYCARHDSGANVPVAVCPGCERHDQAVKARQIIWGEPWRDFKERVRLASPFNALYGQSWDLHAVVVKGGDDMRQELLAQQVIREFHRVFRSAGLPLWLHDLEVLPVSGDAGVIEFIKDSVSVDSLKRQYPSSTFDEIFKMAFADDLFAAQKNFMESLAASSLVVYLLQVRDRHNGNLMIDRRGRVAHIDFGFMLSNSPGGNMGFEQSPFKLTTEYINVMDGVESPQYEYFRALIIRGFLEARKHMDRILLPIELLLRGSKMPCFCEGPEVVLQGLRARFFQTLSDELCIESIIDLIDSSVNNWRTIGYDSYQRVVHGIL